MGFLFWSCVSICSMCFYGFLLGFMDDYWVSLTITGCDGQLCFFMGSYGF